LIGENIFQLQIRLPTKRRVFIGNIDRATFFGKEKLLFIFFRNFTFWYCEVKTGKFSKKPKDGEIGFCMGKQCKMSSLFL